VEFSNAESFVVKIDADDGSIAREVAGHQRAKEPAYPCTELVAANQHGIATRFVVGSLHEGASVSLERAARWSPTP
jgi:hypothetical protein